MQRLLFVAGILAILISIVWWFEAPGYEPLSAFITGIVALIGSFFVPTKEKSGETLDQHNRRIMLNHVENFWVKGVLEKSLHGAALLELGIKEDPTAVKYPWSIKKETTGEVLPAGKSMLEIFHEIGMGRSLLILGAPGSGKTTMLLELARQLIDRARLDEAEMVPVVFNLASWNGQGLADWLAEQLNLLYSVPKKIAPTWVNENRMLLLLDGLDEVPHDHRSKCVAAINQFRSEHGLTSLVLCSRVAEYLVLDKKLSFEGAITLQPLTAQQIDAYIDYFGNSLASVRQLLKRDQALQDLVETPLFLSIMILVYKNRKADELVAASDLKDQRKLLLDVYIARMFDRSTVNAAYSNQQTVRYLSWLASQMIGHNIIAFQIESMQPSWIKKQSHRCLYRLYFGAVFGLYIGWSFGLVSLMRDGLIEGLFIGLSTLVIFGFIGWSDRTLGGGGKIVFLDRLGWSGKQLLKNKKMFAVGVIFVLMFVLFGWLAGGLVFGLAGGLFAGLFIGLTPEEVEETNYPGQRLKQTFINGSFIVILFSSLVGVIVGLFGIQIGDLLVVRLAFPYGLIIGLILGMFFAYLALMKHYTLRLVLERDNLLPWHLIAFLDYAVDLIFLRRVGGSYIFIHRLLMEHFAEMQVTPQPDRAGG